MSYSVPTVTVNCRGIRSTDIHPHKRSTDLHRFSLEQFGAQLSIIRRQRMKASRHALRPPTSGAGSTAVANGQSCVGRASFVQLSRDPLMGGKANAERLSLHCFPPASPNPRDHRGSRNARGLRPRRCLNTLRKIGAGEGIRTLDPDLGKI